MGEKLGINLRVGALFSLSGGIEDRGRACGAQNGCDGVFLAAEDAAIQQDSFTRIPNRSMKSLDRAKVG